MERKSSLHQLKCMGGVVFVSKRASDMACTTFNEISKEARKLAAMETRHVRFE